MPLKTHRLDKLMCVKSVIIQNPHICVGYSAHPCNVHNLCPPQTRYHVLCLQCLPLKTQRLDKSMCVKSVITQNPHICVGYSAHPCNVHNLCPPQTRYHALCLQCLPLKTQRLDKSMCVKSVITQNPHICVGYSARLCNV
ncbi:hypothetical protein TNCV_2323721 [Trichonephila clavipes]|nr:hypothetical protein TNCV_2323721 [Trichonephila clavipes]